VRRYLMWVVLILPQTTLAQSAHVSELLQALQEPVKAEAAADELRQFALISPKNMKEIEDGLAGALKLRSNAFAFKREADLARDLKLSGLAPVLAQRLDEDTRDVENLIGTFHQRNGPDADPAMKALISFGPASIPSLIQELNVGNRLGRFRAINTLGAMGDPEANAALRDRYDQETDAGLKNYLRYKNPSIWQVTARFFLDKANFARGEPVFLYFSLANRGPDPVMIVPVNQEQPSCSGISISVSSDPLPTSSCPFLGGQGCNENGPLPVPRPLLAGETYVARFVLNFDHKFSAPGEYWVDAKRAGSRTSTNAQAKLTFRVNAESFALSKFQP